MAMSIFSTPGRITKPAQPAIQQAPTMAPTQNMGTPNTPRAPVTGQAPQRDWRRGVSGMDRVNTVPGGVQSLYRPPQQQGGMLGGMIQNELAKQQPQTVYGGANDPRLNPANNAAYKTGMNQQAPGGGVVRTSEFRDYDGNGIDDRDQSSIGAPVQSPLRNMMPGGNLPPSSGYDQFKANMPPMPQQPQGNVSSRLFAKPGQGPTATGYNGIGPKPTGDTSTWTPADWQRYNSNNALVNSMMSGG